MHDNINNIIHLIVNNLKFEVRGILKKVLRYFRKLVFASASVHARAFWKALFTR